MTDLSILLGKEGYRLYADSVRSFGDARLFVAGRAGAYRDRVFNIVRGSEET